MTNQEKKEWLNRAIDIQGLITDYEQEYRKALEKARKTTAGYSSSGGGGERNPHKFDRVAEYSERLKAAIDDLYLEKTEILTAIESLKEPIQKRVLTLRYIRGYSWPKVAKVINYSERGVHYIHSQALQNLDIAEHCSPLQ